MQKKVNTKKSSITAILSNYKHKLSISENSVEHTVYKKLLSFDELDNGKKKSENRYAALEWIDDVRNRAKEIEYNSAFKTLNNEPAALIEQDKLELLYKIGWFYNGNFYKNKNIQRDRVGYPNLSFNVSVRRVDKPNSYDKSSPIYMYMASYGIVDNNTKDNSSGSYSLFLTLEECITFILNELEYTHKDILYLNEMRKLFKDSDAIEKLKNKDLKARNDEEKRAHAARALEEFSNDENNQNEVRKRMSRLITNPSIEKELHNLKRSADTTTLLDFINEFLILMAKKNYKDALEDEREANRVNDLVKNYSDTPDPDLVPNKQEVVQEQPRMRSETVLTPPKPDRTRNSEPPVVPPAEQPSSTPEKEHEVKEEHRDVKSYGNINIAPDTYTTDTRDYYSGINISPDKTSVFEENDYANIDISSDDSSVVEEKEYKQDLNMNPVDSSTTVEKEYNSNLDFGQKESTRVQNTFNKEIVVTPNDSSTKIDNKSDYVLDVSPVKSVSQENDFSNIEFEFTEEESKIFNDNDILNIIKDVMPEFLNEDRSPIVKDQDDSNPEHIIDKFD